ncbi:MAG: RNA polymerase sigma factor [Prolixibacteraceae bacterium]|nr:RNA polymerase sigma factor [Prolixibacteraceae bacterium]
MKLYEPIHQRLSNYCRSMASCRADAEDLLNDTALAAFEQFDKLEDASAFAGYLFTIASNLFKKQIRRKKFRGNYNEKEALLIADLNVDAETRTELSLIMQKIDMLPNLQREALILFHISDLPLEEIRKIQGGSLSAVKQRIKRGRERLMQMLTEKQRQVVSLIL